MIRRKVVIVLAVPILFLMSIFFLMSDIKNIPDTNPVLVPPVASIENEGRPVIRKNRPMRPKSPTLSPNSESRLLDPESSNNDNDFNDDGDENKQASNTAGHTQFMDSASQSNSSSSSDSELDLLTTQRQQAVKDAYLHAWNTYVQYAWPSDELQPPIRAGKDWLGMGLSMVDSIDTMWLMDLKEPYKKARKWIENSLHFHADRDISVFETTIRVLGGLISIYQWSGDKMFLEKAKQLGDKLLPAFDSPSGLAKTTINLKSGRSMNPSWAGGACILSEFGTLQMEFASLSKETGNKVYGEKALKAYDVMERNNKPNGLYPVYVDADSGGFRTNSKVTLGALGDSYYEYLIKMWVMTGKKEDKYRRMYNEAMEAVIDKLVKKSTPSGLTYIAEFESGRSVDKMDHLVCFAGAMFALGAYHKITDDVAQHMSIGAEITRSCHEFYKKSRTGLGSEIVNFRDGDDFYTPGTAAHYILRPETVESYFVLWWITGEKKYQDWGWEAFEAIEKHCRTKDGYCGVRNVNQLPVEHDDVQQSFFMAETLKYLYLLFSPRNTVSLDNWVFNTEAHPLKVW